MGRFLWCILGFALFLGGAQRAWCIEVVVDYTYDTEDFFSDPVRREALEAAAARMGRIITSPLLAVEAGDWRIGFPHPGTGESFQISSAANQNQDPISEPADVYGFPGLAEDEWILFAGGYDLPTAGSGGSGTGLNFTDTFDDLSGPFRRGLISNTPDNTVNDLPAWGGSVAFDTSVDWHFDLNSASETAEIDFYSIALHEIAHVLGVATSWNQWASQSEGGYFFGEHAIEAYNVDNGATIERLALGASGNPHWEDGAYESFIFELGEPNLIGTSEDDRQDLLMEPIANFSSQQRRFELTNVDAAALVDLGWDILAPTVDPLDLNLDGQVDVADVDLACAAGSGDLSSYFAVLGSVIGDIDFDGSVGFGDFVVLSNQFSQFGGYSDGDLNCDGQVAFADFLVLSRNFGNSAVASSVPEPDTNSLLLAFFTWCAIARFSAKTGVRLPRSPDVS